MSGYGASHVTFAIFNSMGTPVLAWNHSPKRWEVVARVIRDGAAAHPDNDWVERSPDYHLRRAEDHLRLWRDGDHLQDYVSHAATRLLMALTLRELEG